VVKALVEKLQKPLSLADHCPEIASGNDFFEDFPKNQETEEWRNVIENEVSLRTNHFIITTHFITKTLPSI